MSGRQHKKLNRLIEFRNSIFINFTLKYIKVGWLQSCIQNKLACYVSPALSYYLPSRCYQDKNFHRFCPLNPHYGSAALPWTCCATYSAKYNIQKLNLHVKTDFSKTAWINSRFLRATFLNQLLKSNLCYRLRTNFCGSFVLLFSMFMNIVSVLIFDNNCSIF